MVKEKRTDSSPVLGALVRFLVPACARLPVRFAQTIGSALGALSSIIPNRRRTVAQLNVAMCLPELAPEERARLVRRSLIETGKSALELGAVWSRPTEDLSSLEENIVGGEHFQKAIDAGRGAILLAPHIGNWEFMNYFLTHYPPCVALYRSPRVAELDHFMRGARERTGATLVPATTSGVRQLYKALSAGRPLVILPDQEPVQAAGEYAPFFGIPTLTMTLVNRLLRKTGAGAVFGFAQRSRQGRFTVHISPAPEGLDDPDVVTALGRLNLGVERCVRQCPEQYMWTYKRFKTRPEGELTPYRQRSFLPENRNRLDPVILERLRDFC